jgi:hypothetical protein
MVNYQNSKIYKIWSPHTELIYIGSTTRLLCQRLGDHQTNYKSYKEDKRHYVSSFKILEYGDAKIELIENYSCNNKEELTKKEGEFIRQYKDICVNICIAGRTQQEWCIDNKEQIAEQKKIYREEHKEQIAERKKRYYEEHKEQILEKDRKYYEEHKQQRLEYATIYREEHKEQLAEKYKKHYEEQKSNIYKCICGSMIQSYQKSIHFKSKKHQSYMNDTLFNLLDL